MKQIELRLSRAEVNHLLAHFEENGRKTDTNYDWYYGNRTQFESRHEQLKQKLKRIQAFQKRRNTVIFTKVCREILYFKMWNERQKGLGHQPWREKE